MKYQPKKQYKSDSEKKLNELFNKLQDGVQHVYTSDAWKSFLVFQSRFHQYSFRNALLIMLQCPFASHVAGFEEWKKFERHVKKGGRSIKVLAPHFKNGEKDENGVQAKKLSGFHMASVFDISETEGKEVPTLCKELIGDTKALREFYENAIAVSPFPVEEVKIDNGAKGYFSHETISIGIKKGMAVKQKAKTLIHEITHGMLHRMTDPRREELTKNDREIEAEGTAFVVLSYFGFDTSEYSFPYLANWGRSEGAQAIQRAGDVIQKTAEIIINMLEKKAADKEVPADVDQVA